MYRRDSMSWVKHLDFILLDMLSLQLAYVLGVLLASRGTSPYGSTLYRSVAIVIEMCDLAIALLYGTFKNVLRRGFYKEFTVTVKHTIILAAVMFSYLFITKQGGAYSRVALFTTLGVYVAVTYLVRCLRKKQLHDSVINKESADSRSLFIVTNYNTAEEVIKNFKEHNFSGYHIAGLGIADRYAIGETFEDVKVTGDAKTIPLIVGKEWVDEVLVVTSQQEPLSAELMNKLLETGVTLHLNLLPFSHVEGKKQFVEKVGNYPVLTISLNYASFTQLFLKRCMDILAGLVGCFITLILLIFIGPAIYIHSPGPIFFAQERVGKNGKRFKMYKFRSMYMDAEERKAALLQQNRIRDGRMFKLDFDPRIIGNEILPDGTHKTGIGQFIRDTSLDEFPQFFNVLKGDMSLVGTRPPTIDETELYELHHYARLAVKPGITGMWQVSGRSEITNFEEVVRLDKEYITKWNFGLDIKIILKTIAVVFKKEGSM